MVDMLRIRLLGKTFPRQTRVAFWSSGPKKTVNKAPLQGRKISEITATHTNYDHFSWLNKFGPCYPVHGDKVLVLTEPTQYFEVLKLKIKKAKKRVILASLYLGTGSLEDELVDCLQEACANAAKEGNGNFKVRVLIDYTRGSRGKDKSSRTMLQPLLCEYGGNVQIALYHTPDLRGLLKKIVPERFNETIGLTHIKAYICDDSVMISGANLSDNYFVNRQDRYILFNECGDLADFFDKMIQTVSKFSFQLKPDNSVTLHPNWSLHPFKDNEVMFKSEAKEQILKILENQKLPAEDVSFSPARIFKRHTKQRKYISLPRHSSYTKNGNSINTNRTQDKPHDTWVYPLIQMGPFGIIFDEYATLSLLREAAVGDEILLASGYFNLTDHYLRVILQQSFARYKILMASPEVNGFYGAKGIAGSIPAAYIHIAKQFYNQLMKYGQTQRIQMCEYYRQDWTFHVKGLWYYLPNQALPSLTLVGSPNFGYRSVYRDLECQTAIVTDNTRLQEQLRQEHVRLYQSSNPVKEDLWKRRDRHVPTWVKLVTSVIKNFF
ncbi:CDP-diacylglycerol--glycerol-3-phosphate 3-phosphatidyltransferase, mitochondrial [Patella vulgata]|uniref:CDP-diacylglycerol--glycerol-3-phosphate 3-phosphatidyltransferase, mitochondrial n=1 Tax=Patella vulgata TaxID=6465 RepID=UPI00218014D0|nr:CDP-diacylglycerol--glycerol-3-phosphate 3-phosphatidyltransferase, mitochondrial [Patella vulgata]